MSPADQARYAAVAVPDAALAPRLDHRPSAETTSDERKEQGTFANWLLLQNSNGADLPFEWHPLHTRSKTTPGCFDFWVGAGPVSIWIEFKKDHAQKLSDAQQEFRRKCDKRGIPAYVVYNAQQAIDLVQKAGMRSR
jgi:hypothetical protein